MLYCSCSQKWRGQVPDQFRRHWAFPNLCLPAGPDDGERSRQKTEREDFTDDNHIQTAQHSYMKITSEVFISNELSC